MSTQAQFRRGTAAQHNSFVGAPGEITVDTTNNNLRVHDGVTPGGHPLTLQSLFNAHLADKSKYARFAIVANQSIPNDTFTQINWVDKQSYNGEDFCAIENGRIKILKTGMYQLQVQMQWAGNATGRRQYWGRTLDDIIPASTSSIYMGISEFVYATTGTLLNTRVYQNSGGALDLIAGGNTFCEIRKVV